MEQAGCSPCFVADNAECLWPAVPHSCNEVLRNTHQTEPTHQETCVVLNILYRLHRTLIKLGATSSTCWYCSLQHKNRTYTYITISWKLWCDLQFHIGARFIWDWSPQLSLPPPNDDTGTYNRRSTVHSPSMDKLVNNDRLPTHKLSKWLMWNSKSTLPGP